MSSGAFSTVPRRPTNVGRHLEGVAAIMENHFRYEERQLLTVLDSLELTVEPSEALGSL